MSSVGVIANPASGRDVRRLVAGASVVDNAEKGAMVHRLMVGLGAVGVGRVIAMPADSGLTVSIHRALRGRSPEVRAGLPVLEMLDMRLDGTACDTCRAVELMVARDVAAIVVLGGDGTHRLVARHGAGIPLCGLSTGTNNAFPTIREATIAGVATGLVATQQVTTETTLRRQKILRVSLNGEAGRDCALVDAALTRERFVAARAMWRASALVETVLAFGEPGSIGLSALAGILDPVSRSDGHGLHVRLDDPDRAATVARVPIAPGLIVPVGVAAYRRIAPGETVELEGLTGSLALDGERELELDSHDRVGITLALDGPRMIDVDAVMAEASRRGAMVNASAADGSRTGRVPAPEPS